MRAGQKCGLECKPSCGCYGWFLLWLLWLLWLVFVAGVLGGLYCVFVIFVPLLASCCRGLFRARYSTLVIGVCVMVQIAYTNYPAIYILNSPDTHTYTYTHRLPLIHTRANFP
jgi:hypothetical protein